jgi:hypothetical protein
MARYLPLFAIQIAHAYFDAPLNGGDASQPLSLMPSKASAILMQQESLLLRQRGDGIEIWQEEKDANAAVNTELITLEFLARSSDPHFEFYTEWPVARPLCFVNQIAAELETPELELQANSVAASDFGMDSFERQQQPVLFSVQIQHAIKYQENAVMTVYRLPLAAKALHWKYYFSGALSKKELEIVDVDALQDEANYFTASTNGVGERSLAFISERRLTMRSNPTQRLQLREKGANGRVLMRRLPNASIHKIGKERTPDGQTLIVAEIYIHQ